MKTLLVALAGLSVVSVSLNLSSGVATPWVQRLGWTLLHSVWQISLLAIVAAIVLRALKNQSAATRYTASVACFGLMAITPLITWTFLEKHVVSEPAVVATAGRMAVDEARAPGTSATDSKQDRSAKDGVLHGNALPVEAAVETSGRVLVETTDPVENAAIPAKAMAEGDPLSVPPTHVAVGKQVPVSAVTGNSLVTFIGQNTSLIVRFWLLGILICSIRPISSVWAGWRLCRHAVTPVSESMEAIVIRLSRRFGLSRSVCVLQSALVKVPMVVGYLRPVILLPGAVVTGLTTDQLEAVLAHELAHVRRHDWLMNSLQVVVETLLFYHPAVWRLSKRIRQERELCCDDMALKQNVDKAVYARMLLMLEELRQEPASPALAATGGDLAQRIRRLLPGEPPRNPPSRLSGGGFAVAVLTILAAVSSAALVNTPNQNGGNDPAKTVVKDIENGETPVPGENSSDNADNTSDNGDTPAPQESPRPVETQPRSSELAVSPNASIEAKEDTDTDEQPAPNALMMRSIQVLDENEQPIVGADVQFQFQHSGDGSFMIDALNSTKTDAEGRVKTEAPEGSESVYISIKADGFGKFSESQQPTGSSIIRLKRGRVIHVRAVDEAGELLDKAVPLLQGHRTWGREFVAQDDGTFKSPAVDMKRRLMRVVSAQQDGPLLFSDLLDVESLKPGDDGITQVTLKPGTRLTGRLDDSVPRPITEGYVDLMVVEGLNHTLSTSHNRFQTGAWAWEDSAPVQPDGTFTFESVPSGGVAQVHVVVDGYMSINPPLKELAEIIRTHANGDETTLKGLQEYVSRRAMWPYLVPVRQPTAEVVIACQKTASCDFRILDPGGNPIPDATVSFSPNGIFINGSLFIPGSNDYGEAALVHQLFRGQANRDTVNKQDPTPRDIAIAKEREWARRSFLGAKSDADGRVKIRNLPGGTRESFRVNAAGFVLPHSPLYPDSEDRREGYIDLVAGETVEATIYLERDQPVIDREILVVNDEGRPLPKATIALMEMRVGSKDWQMWSSQRFGTLQSAVTDESGRVVLSVPSSIDNKAVEQLRLAVNYREEQKPRPVGEKHSRLWLNGALVDLPLKEDGGVVAVVQGAEESRPDRATYGKLADILHGIDSKQLLEKMIERPGLALLRQMLTASDKPYPQPIELLDEGRFGLKTKGVKVRLIPTTTSRFALVSAKVRPLNGTRSEETEMSRLPECVFVFDAEGRYVASIGGEIGTTGAGSPENVNIICLGPAEDWFVRTSRFQENGAFEYQSKYYRIGDSVVESLKYFHYANSNSWSMGPEKVPRYGALHFQFPDRKYAVSAVGLSPENVAMNAAITWDGDRNQFFGAVSQTIDGRPLFEVDTNWSKDFQALAPRSDQMVLAGGARDYDHWYGWQTVVPKGFEAVVRVTVPQAEGETQTLEQKLTEGRQMIQFQAKPSEGGQSFSLQLGYGKDQEIQKADLPVGAADQPAAAVAVVNIVSSGESVRLVDRPLQNSSSLTLDVLLNPLTE